MGIQHNSYTAKHTFKCVMQLLLISATENYFFQLLGEKEKCAQTMSVHTLTPFIIPPPPPPEYKGVTRL